VGAAVETEFGESRFRRQLRLTDSTDFDKVFRNSRRSVDGCFTVLYRPNGLRYARLGLAIAKKRVRRAVGRNRLKRIIRESFRGAQQQLIGRDIVILARHNAEGASNAVLYESLRHHWQSLTRDQPKHG
jgi:ribonuclease P protein component